MRASGWLLLIIYLGFISLGLPDGTLGVAWPRMHRDLGLPIGLAGVLVVVATLLSAYAGFSSGRWVSRWGTPRLVAGSCGLTGSGLLVISQADGLGGLLFAAVPLGLGAGAVDAALNGFVARHYEARHMNWLHACWGVGATCGPLVLAQTMAINWGWRGGFVILAGAQLSLAVLFLGTLRGWSRVPERPVAATPEEVGAGAAVAARAPANSLPGWLSAAIFVGYTAVEGTTGVWAGSILVKERGIAAPVAGVCAAAFYGAITVGRIVVGFMAERVGNRRLVNLGLILAAGGGAALALTESAGGAGAALILMGLGFAPVYPCLMHEVPRRFAPEAVQTVIGRQSGSGAFGTATLPAAAGLLAIWSLELIPPVIFGGIVLVLLAVQRLNRLT